MVIAVQDFNLFIRKIQKEKSDSYDEVIIPSNSVYKNNGNLFFTKLRTEDQQINLGAYRTVDPIKILFYSPREKVLPGNYKNKKRLLVGVKACDINALLFLDRALLESGFTDPAYYHWRKNTVIISTDCRTSLPNCFCSFTGGQPYPAKGFDLNLSKIDDDYYIEMGSETGVSLIHMMKEFFPVKESTLEIIKKVQAQREKLLEEVENNVESKLREYPEPHNASEEELWKQGSKSCVGCGSCTNGCPTCYCLILNDESVSDEFIKVRSYDSCQLYGYARVAGGGTPRKKIHQRFRNRVMCKFSYTKSNFDMYGCTGCGRCLDTCGPGNAFLHMAKIIREKETEQIHTS